jgi:hypothetical protein
VDELICFFRRSMGSRLSKIDRPNVDCGSRTQIIKMAIYPYLRSLPSQRAKLPEEPAIGVKFA